MEKITLIGISNREDELGLTIKKSEGYYPFVFKLLKEFGERLPDIQDYLGNDPRFE